MYEEGGPAAFGGLDTIVVFTANSLQTIAVYTLVTAVCPPQVEATLKKTTCPSDAAAMLV